MPADKEFDVFLSHSSVDSEWVNNLKNDLERFGLKVWADDDQIRPGDQFIDALESGIETSKSVALVVSPEAIESDWVREEYHLALRLSKDKNHLLRLVPLMLRGKELPSFLGNRSWVDFRESEKYEIQLRELIRGITGYKMELINILKIPCVIISMNNSEAQNLFSKEVFNDPEVSPAALNRFNSFLEILDQDELSLDWDYHYNVSREDWIPFYDKELSISAIVWEIASILGQNLDRPNKNLVIQPKFVSDIFFSLDDFTATNTWGKLKEHGGFMIVDGVSLYHPKIKKIFDDSRLDTEDNVTTFFISPISSDMFRINASMKEHISSQMKFAFHRYAIQLKAQNEYGVDSLISLKRRLKFTLPQIASTLLKNNIKPENKAVLQELVDSDQNTAYLIFGEL